MLSDCLTCPIHNGPHSYIEQMEPEFFLVNNIKEDRKKVAVLISTVGSQTYKLLKDLCSPDKPNTKSFENLVTCLQNHLATTCKANNNCREIYINGQQVWMEIDTGAALSVVSQKILWIPVKQSSKQLQDRYIGTGKRS